MAAKKNVKRFQVQDQIERKIVDDSGVIGCVKIKPNGVGWKAKHAQVKFKFVEWKVLEDFLNTCPDAREIR